MSLEEKATLALSIGEAYLGVENGHLTRIDVERLLEGDRQYGLGGRTVPGRAPVRPPEHVLPANDRRRARFDCTTHRTRGGTTTPRSSGTDSTVTTAVRSPSTTGSAERCVSSPRSRVQSRSPTRRRCSLSLSRGCWKRSSKRNGRRQRSTGSISSPASSPTTSEAR